MRPKTIRNIIAANVKMLRDAAGVSRREFARQRNLDLRLLERAETAEVAIGVDALDPLARGLRTEPWRLVHASMGVGEMVGLTAAEADLISQLRALDDADRQRVLALWGLTIELRRGPPTPPASTQEQRTRTSPEDDAPTPRRRASS